MSHKTKQDRRDEAQERNAAWEVLALETKLGRLHSRPGMSERQRHRLMAPLTERKSKKAAARRAQIAEANS